MSKEQDHTVTVRIDDGTAIFTFECGASDDAMCRVTCDQGCETWNAGHEHKLLPIDHCTFCEWTEEVGADEIHEGTQTIAIDVPVQIFYEQGIGYTWDLAKEATR
jgi:hypothetical protein